ncbi:MAG: lytic transglycosylase, catalytic [Burkholderiales bacterium]|nr:MAG: lytic transglycosylase, catalytic [Burkholderiales bacterium]
MLLRACAFVVGFLCASAPVFGQQASTSAGSLGSMPLTNATRCVVKAAERHSVNPWVLKAILKVESNFKPGAVTRNTNGSVDLGMAQINSIHLNELAKYGVGEQDLLEPCVSTYVAAWHLAKQHRRHGNTWFAVGAYHSATPCFNTRYVGLIWNTLIDWKVVEAQRAVVQPLSACRARGRASPSERHAEATPNGLLAFDH